MAARAGGGGISRWPESERPRERLIREGPEFLSEAQLLAILLRIGRADSSAVQVAMELLDRLEGLPGLANRGIEELCQVPGIGLAKAAQLKAAIELGKRVLATPLSTGTKITSSRDLYHHYYPRFRDLRHEVFQLVLLDAKHAIIRDATVSKGSLTLSIVHPRDVFNLAVRESAATVIFLHNHPSGDPEPSPEDRALTARLVAAGRCCASTCWTISSSATAATSASPIRDGWTRSRPGEGPRPGSASLLAGGGRHEGGKGFAQPHPHLL